LKHTNRKVLGDGMVLDSVGGSGCIYDSLVSCCTGGIGAWDLFHFVSY
jgi:hypothetical protein